MVKFDDLTRKSLPHYRARVQAIGPESPRRWGSMTPAAMMAHVRRAIEISLEEAPTPNTSTWFTRAAGPLVFRYMPWPKGKLKTIPEMLPERTEELERERAELLAAMERFVDRLEREPQRRAVSSLLGNITMRRWSMVHGRHLTHHLDQFGV